MLHVDRNNTLFLLAQIPSGGNEGGEEAGTEEGMGSSEISAAGEASGGENLHCAY